MLDAGVSDLGRLDVVAANAGIFMFGEPTQEVAESDWDDAQDINVKGVWHTRPRRRSRTWSPRARAGRSC